MSYVCWVIRAPKQPFEREVRKIPDVGPEQVLIKVRACGLCHSDCFCQDGAILHFGGSYPRVPGHEIAGEVAALGSAVTRVTKGQRVGVPWTAETCGKCDHCRRGNEVLCPARKVPGIHIDGGYAEYALFHERALVRLPDALSFEELAPLMCAGVTVFNSLRRHAPMVPATIGVQAVGGLGHLAIQFAKAMGYRVVAISRGTEKKELALKLGAHAYIDSEKQDIGKEMQALGGANVILATAPSGASHGPLIPALAQDGTLIVLGVDPQKIDVTPAQLLSRRCSILGWPSGGPLDSEDTAKFAAFHGIKPMLEVFPLDKAPAAFDRMMTGKANFRVVLVPSTQ